jgi:hypothetical protein
MGFEKLHEAREDVSEKALELHRAYLSLIEELEAIDWYNQRIAAGSNAELEEILMHNMNEEMEHAAMIFEWLRRNHDGWDEMLAQYLYKKGRITDPSDKPATGAGQHLDLGPLQKNKGE